MALGSGPRCRQYNHQDRCEMRRMNTFRFNLFSCLIVIFLCMSRDHISSSILHQAGPAIILYTMPHLNLFISDLAYTER